MSTVLAPLNQVIQPYVFRGGGGSSEDKNKNNSTTPISVLKSSPKNGSMNIVSEGGLEMVYEDSSVSPNNDRFQNSRYKQNCLIGPCNNNDPSHANLSLSPSPSILRRSRSLPQDEFRILGQKLGELERNDSIVSGRSGR